MEQKYIDLFAKHLNAAYIRQYHVPFVPLAYKWPAPAKRTIIYRDGYESYEMYDRKRSYGIGPTLVVCSAFGGTIHSY